LNLPDAPIAHESFFATHFFTVRDQEKSKGFYVRILGGKVIKPDNPYQIKLITVKKSTMFGEALSADFRSVDVRSGLARSGSRSARLQPGCNPVL
jgi:hypothetical protein